MFTVYKYLDEEVKENAMGGACGTDRREKRCI